MIGFFPDPYPDELLYSTCARFGDRSNYRNVATVAKELFGSSAGVAVISFPNRIGHLVSVLPPGHRYTVDRLIDDHTPLRFYSPFIESSRSKIIRREMRGCQENRICSRLGINAGRLASPNALRFCPECVKADRQQYGETYWHRIHQLAGVHVCPNHAVFLVSSLAGCRERQSSKAFISADRIVNDMPIQPIDPRSREHNILLKIAQDAKWLLSWRGIPPTGAERRQRYHNLLLTRGLAYYNGRVRHTELIKQFREFYPANLLQSLQSQIGNQSQPWPLRILRQDRLDEIQPPLRHLLLMTFSESTAEQFFTTFEEYKPFGDGPWPCLNPASNHFKENVIDTCRITNGHKKIKGRPVGFFACDCGFRYLRVDPDRNASDRLRIKKVISYGSIWEQYFTRAWSDPSITLTDLAQRLNVIPFTLRRHAIRLRLPFPRPGRWSRPTSEKVIKEHSNTLQTYEESFEARRAHWLTVRKQNPKAGRKRLISLAPYTYYWLSRHDVEWLRQHSPQARINNPEPIRVDWKGWDVVLSKGVRSLSSEIRKTAGRPVRVSKEEIIRRLGHRSWFELHLDKLPKTSSSLSKCLEPREDFLVRRVSWTEQYFVGMRRCPSLRQFDVRAGTRTKLGGTPQVRKAIEAALTRLAIRFTNSDWNIADEPIR